MKNKKALILLFILLSAAIVLGTGCKRRIKPPDEVLEALKDLKSYTSNVDIILKNDRQELKYECRQYYGGKEGYRLEIGSDRVQIYKDDKIYVNDKKSGSNYVLERDFDKIYSLSFIGNYIKLLYTNETIKYSTRDVEGKTYQIVELLMPGDNRNLYRAEMYIDTKTYLPEKVIVYDKKDNEKVLIQYSNFKPNEDLKKELFKVE